AGTAARLLRGPCAGRGAAGTGIGARLALPVRAGAIGPRAVPADGSAMDAPVLLRCASGLGRDVSGAAGRADTARSRGVPWPTGLLPDRGALDAAGPHAAVPALARDARLGRHGSDTVHDPPRDQLRPRAAASRRGPRRPRGSVPPRGLRGGVGAVGVGPLRRSRL